MKNSEEKNEGKSNEWCQTFVNHKISEAFSYFKQCQVLGGPVLYYFLRP
jgi:hypothetical protein